MLCGFESSGLEQRPWDVAGEVTEAERGPAEVVWSAVDGLRRAVRGTRPIEEREDVGSALLHGAAELADLDQRGRNTGDARVDHVTHHLFGLLLVGLAVGRDDALVDAPGRFDLDVLLVF